MCLQIPGKVIGANEKKIVVDYDIEKRDATVGDVTCGLGDWVIVVGGFVVDVVPEKVGREALEHWKKTMV